MRKLGRFRFSFRASSPRLSIIKWWRFSVGYESKRFRKWKKRLREAANKESVTIKGD